MRINKFIAHSGYASRRKADILIENSKVYVNNKIITDYSYDVKVDDIVRINNQILTLEKKVYFKLNKPVGTICSNFDPFNSKKVIDLVDTKKRIYPVGRLDKDSEGLILLTNDGEITNKIIHPSKKVEKEYIVKVNSNLSELQMEEFISGIKLEEKVTERCFLKLIDKNKSVYKVIIHEGLNRQIRRMFAYFGKNVYSLKRIRIGKIQLGNLKIGTYQKLNTDELNYLKDLI
ncbi:MAG: pseudouridine synthase [Tissierellia bacterium]|nr:pseudouridine synthase [Tissierellia bacterium]